MENLRVVKRNVACRFKEQGCGKCDYLYHITGEGNSTTLCGHACTPMEDWSERQCHIEDIAAIDRCQNCYSQVS